MRARRIGVAVIGAGYWGPNLIRNFAALPECRLAAVCDLNQARLDEVAARYPDTRTTSRVADILSDDEVAAVVIAAPAETHRSLGEACLRAGKDVYVEKPLATSSEDASALVCTAREMGRVLMVGHLFMFHPAVTGLIDLVRRGAIGQIRYAHGIRTSMSGTARLDTSVIWDSLIHDAYVLPAVFGRLPRRVQVVGQGYLTPELEDVAFATFDFGEGAIAQIYASWYALEKARQLTVIGAEGILVYDDLKAPHLAHYRRRYERSLDVDPRGRPRWHWRDEGCEPVEVESIEPLRAECQHFVECVATGLRPRTDGLAGLEAVRVLEMCERSVAAGGTWVEAD